LGRATVNGNGDYQLRGENLAEHKLGTERRGNVYAAAVLGLHVGILTPMLRGNPW